MRWPAAILGLLLACGLATSKKCGEGDFCGRWVCEQLNNRRNAIREACSDEGLDFAKELAACNAAQDATFTKDCTLSNGKTIDVGYRYNKSQCADPVPKQLQEAGKLAVKAMSYAIEGLEAAKFIKAFDLAQPKVSKSSECAAKSSQQVHPCVCDGNDHSCPEEVKSSVLTDTASPHFSKSAFDDLSGQFVQFLAFKLVELGAQPDAAAALAEAQKLCKERYPNAACL